MDWTLYRFCNRRLYTGALGIWYVFVLFCHWERDWRHLGDLAWLSDGGVEPSWYLEEAMKPDPRRSMLFLLFVAWIMTIFAAPLAAEAQPVGKVWRIGMLSVSLATRPVIMAAFADGMRDRGYVEGRDYIVERRFVPARLEEYSELVAELVRLNVDLIIASDTAATRAAMQATQTIPIVIVGLRDPVGDKLIANLARPGGNVTGIGGPPYAELDGKRLELIKAVVPGLKRVALLQNLPRWAYNDAANAEYRQSLDRSARTLGCSLVMFDLADSDDFEAFFAKMVKAGAGALLVPGDPFVNAHRKRIIDLAARHGLPAIYGQDSFGREGGLMRYGEDALAVVRGRLPYYLDRIFKGAKPAELPVEQPTKFELVINLKTAKALGLTIPQSLLLRADQVIE